MVLMERMESLALQEHKDQLVPQDPLDLQEILDHP